MSLTLEREISDSGIALIKAEGEIDHHTFETLSEELTGTIDSGVVKIVIDLEKVSYISSAGLGALVGAMSEVEAADNGAFVLCGLIPEVKAVFDSMGFTPMFTLADGQEQAVSMAQAGS